MTDFLQQQEFVQESAEVEPEKTIEELSTAVVESYMEMATAFAAASNAFECAEIVAFCETSSIQVPETAKVIVESAWDAIKSFFAKAWDWIRSILTALVAAFTASRIRVLIGKVQQMKDADFEKAGSKVKAAALDVSLVEVLMRYLGEFNTQVITPLKTNDDPTTIKDIEAAVDKFDKDLEKLVKIKFKTLVNSENAETILNPADYEFKECISSTVCGEYAKRVTEAASAEAKKAIAPDVDKAALVKALQDLNKLDFPRRGGKLLKELDFKAKEAKGANDKNEQTVIDKSLVRKIEKVARMFARLYDRISIAIAWMSDMKDFKDDKPSSKEDFKKAVEKEKSNANKGKVTKVSKSGTLTESAEVETEDTEVTTEAEEPKIEETQPDVKTEADDDTAADEGIVEEQATPVITAKQVIENAAAAAAANTEEYFDN